MRNRTLARECALKILYAVDITKDSFTECAENFWQNNREIKKEVKEFSDFLLSGISSNLQFIDSVISKYATNWEIGRMATIDRNILRLSTFELLLSDNIPPKVSINEAIELAKNRMEIRNGSFLYDPH